MTAFRPNAAKPDAADYGKKDLLFYRKNPLSLKKKQGISIGLAFAVADRFYGEKSVSDDEC